MKKIFSILFVLSFAFAFANENMDPPVFEETDEKECLVSCASPFLANEPLFQEDQEEAKNEPQPPEVPIACSEEDCECDDGKCSDDKCEDGDCQASCAAITACKKCDEKKRPKASYISWKRYKVNFGVEKIFLRFPYSPTVSQSNTLLTAFAYDHGLTYSFTGYFPPMGNIAPGAWFDEILFSLTQYPLTCVSHVVFQASSGDWVLDYVAHDYVRDLIIKTRAVVTPFNAYTIQIVKPNGARDHFDYFLESFWIKCDCN